MPKATLQPGLNLNRNPLESWRWVDLAMIYFFVSRFMTALFATVLGSKGIFVSMGVLGILYLLSVREVWREKKGQGLLAFIWLVLGLVFLTLLTMLFNPEAKEWILDFDYGLITRTLDLRKGIFGALVILLVRQPEKLTRNFATAAWISFAYHLFQGALFLGSGSWAAYYILEESRPRSYNLTYGYEMIFVAIVFLALWMNKRKLVYFTAGMVAFLSSFIFGSRGSLLPFLAFLFLALVYTLWNQRIHWKKELRRGILAAVLFAVIAILLLVLARITGSMDAWAPRTGIRNIDMLLSMDFVDDNGRFIIWGHALEAIRASFPLGFGVFGDRPFVGRDYRWGYSHNIFLELAASFGIFGLAAAIFLLALVARSLFRKSFSAYAIPLIILSAMNAKLLISDSFWFYDYFWALIGLLLVIHLDRNLSLPPARAPLEMRTGLKQPLGLIVTALLIVANLGALGLLLVQDVRGQKYNTVAFNTPSVIIILEDGGKAALQRGIKEMERRGLKASVVANPKIFSAEELAAMAANANLDLHLELGYRPMTTESWPLLKRYLDGSKKLLQANGIQPPYALTTYSKDIFPATFRFLREESDGLILPLLKNQNYYYSSVSEQDIYKLGALNSSIAKSNYRRMGFIKRQIDLARDNEALIVLYFRNIQVYSRSPDGRSLTFTRYFREILDQLEASQFQFLTLTELLNQARIPEEQKTLGNLLKNTEIYQKLFN